MPDVLPVTQPTASKHWLDNIAQWSYVLIFTHRARFTSLCRGVPQCVHKARYGVCREMTDGFQNSGHVYERPRLNVWTGQRMSLPAVCLYIPPEWCLFLWLPGKIHARPAERFIRQFCTHLFQMCRTEFMYSQFMRILYHFILYVFLSRVSVLIWDSCMSVCLSVCHVVMLCLNKST